MSKKKFTHIDDLLEHPEVKKVTSHLNQEFIDRRNYSPPVCEVFNTPVTALEHDDTYLFDIDRETEKQLPDLINNKVQRIIGVESPAESLTREYGKQRNIGIVFSGGPAPGGHNVIAGLFDAAKSANPDTRIYGFILGPDGIIENEAVELTRVMVDRHRNIGGFSMIKTGRTKIDTKEKMDLSRKTCKALNLNALIIVGGDDSNTNAAFLAQEMADDGVQVIGVPKTIDGDIQVRDAAGKVLCAISFGFHTAARAFAKEIANLCTDSNSDVKYWHICKVMGRVASHLALEVALQTHANMTLIGEDLAEYDDPDRILKAAESGTVDYTAYGITLRHLSRVICDGIVRRAWVGKNYGVAVIPEGVLEFINEIQIFITKLNVIIADYNNTHDNSFHQDFKTLEEKLDYLRRMARQSKEESAITVWSMRDDDLFNDVPAFFQEGLLMERDSHGNFPFSQVETDKIIMGLVTDYLDILKDRGIYKIGIHHAYYSKKLSEEGLDPVLFGKVLFRNYGESDYLLIKESIISMKTLKQALTKKKLLDGETGVPPVIKNLYRKSVPKFKTQVHFYGYDGRGSDPSSFDCNYTYNLGLTVFSLIANKATGQMAAIKNLELDFTNWEPIGIPIAPLMRLEERKGRLTLVLEKSIVATDSVAFRVVKALREEWLAAVPGDDNYRNPGPIRFTGESEEERPITLVLNALDR